MWSPALASGPNSHVLSVESGGTCVGLRVPFVYQLEGEHVPRRLNATTSAFRTEQAGGSSHRITCNLATNLFASWRNTQYR